MAYKSHERAKHTHILFVFLIEKFICVETICTIVGRFINKFIFIKKKNIFTIVYKENSSIEMEKHMLILSLTITEL